MADAAEALLTIRKVPGTIKVVTRSRATSSKRVAESRIDSLPRMAGRSRATGLSRGVPRIILVLGGRICNLPTDAYILTTDIMAGGGRAAIANMDYLSLAQMS